MSTPRTLRSLSTALALLLIGGASVGAQTSAVLGQVALPREIAPVARRPDIRGVGMPRARNAAPRRESVVYVDVAPREAFEAPDVTSVIVDQHSETFAPHIVAIEAGTEVDFPNSDETYHNVFSLSPAAAFDLGRYAAGRSKSVRFERPGIVRVFCDIHSHMSAFVLVFGHRFFAVTDGDGRYRIGGVPPGRYTVVAWHERFGRVSQSIQVPEGGDDVNLDFTFQEH